MQRSIWRVSASITAVLLLLSMSFMGPVDALTGTLDSTSLEETVDKVLEDETLDAADGLEGTTEEEPSIVEDGADAILLDLLHDHHGDAEEPDGAAAPGTHTMDAGMDHDGHGHLHGMFYEEQTESGPAGSPYDDYALTKHEAIASIFDEVGGTLDHLMPDTDPGHAAAMVLDRSWGITYSTFTASSISQPITGITGADWHLNDVPLDAQDQGDLAEDGYLVRSLHASGGGEDARQDMLQVQISEPGYHFLTLTVRWDTPQGQVTQRTTTPIYVEEAAIDHITPDVAQRAYYDPESDSVLAALLRGDADGAVERTEDALEALLRDPTLPTVMVISDFLADLEPLAGGLVNLDPGAFQNLIGGSGVGTEPAGLDATDLVHLGTTTLGHPVHNIGQTLAETVARTSMANVVFVRGIDPATGALDRPAIRNALDVAAQGGIDAVVWGLPSAVYTPGLTKNQMRPDFAFQSTPRIPVDPNGPPPTGSDLRDVLDGHVDLKSVVSRLVELAYLVDDRLEAGAGVDGLVSVLANNMDEVYPVYRPLVRELERDAQFDRFLQSSFLSLSKIGVPLVAPSEECPAMQDQYMTVLGVSHLAGTLTVAAGTQEDGADPVMCKGPDRRQDAHGNGVDLVADPRPSVPPGLMEALVGGTTVGDLLEDGAENLIPFLPNSLGASLRTAVKLAEMRAVLVGPDTPWQSQDLTGMLVGHAQSDEDRPVWDQGVGFVDLDAVRPEAPEFFPRGTQVVFNPFNTEQGSTFAVAQVVVRGAQNVAAWENAPDSAWGVQGGTAHRLVPSGPWGQERSVEALGPGTAGRIAVDLERMEFLRLDSETGIATFVLSAAPGADLPGDAWNAAGIAPPSEWLFPGLYSGRTWISTPNGILQLPIHIGVGTIVDVYRFIHPDEPVGDTAVCLALPDILGDLGLRQTSMTLGTDEICLYWTNTDEHGVARFYNPLPLVPYTLISWFDGRFAFRGGDGQPGTVYPHIMEEGISFPLPLNLSGITDWLLTAGDGLAEDLGAWVASGGNGDISHFRIDLDPEDPSHPIFVDGSLPYPLVHIPINITAPLAIAINWFYRDNMETDHFIPLTSTNLVDLVESIIGQPMPGLQGTAAGPGLLRAAPDAVPSLLGTAHDPLKAAIPVDDLPLNPAPELLDNLLGQPLGKAVPLNLDVDSSVCQWGYGHQQSPSLSDTALAMLQNPDLAGHDPSVLRSEVQAHLGTEYRDPGAPWPDALTMRVRPTLDHLLGMTGALPLCSTVYPFGVPQPNYYPTIVTHEFDLHLEASLMLVCIKIYSEQCWLLAPGVGVGGDPVAISLTPGSIPNLQLPALTDLDASMLLDTVRHLPFDLLDDPLGFLDDALATGIDTANLSVLQQIVDSLPHIGVGLPEASLDLTSEGRVRLQADLVSAERSSGTITYTGIPIFLLGSGLLDPIVGLLWEHGVDVTELLTQELDLGIEGSIDVGPVPGMAQDAVSDLGQLLRDSAGDLLTVQPYIEVSRAVMHLDAWWWDDFFRRVPVVPVDLLPRPTELQCPRMWADLTYPALWEAGGRFPYHEQQPGDDGTCVAEFPNPVVGDGRLAGTAGRPDGGFDLAEDWWWLTFPNLHREKFERGLRYWDPVTLQPDMDSLQGDGYPWQQAEYFEVVMQQWNHHEIRAATPNQLHTHGRNLDHLMADSAKHCTFHRAHDPLGRQLNLDVDDARPWYMDGTSGDHAATEGDLADQGIHCIEGLLDQDEGNAWMIHDDDWGTGIYDPALGHGIPDLIYLQIIDDLLEQLDALNHALWSTHVEWGDVSLSPRQLVIDTLGIDMLELQWWKRDATPLANRTIYADLYQNSSFMLWTHHVTCKETWQMRQAPLPDAYPRWKTSCPWIEEGDGSVLFGVIDPGKDLLVGNTEDGWTLAGTAPDGGRAVPADPDDPIAGNVWWHLPGVRCQPPPFAQPWPPGADPTDAEDRRTWIEAFYSHYGEAVEKVVVYPPRDGHPQAAACGAYTGWDHYVRAPKDFNGGLIPKWNAYNHVAHPLFHEGTYAQDLTSWLDCRDGLLDADWPCTAGDPTRQAWDDLRQVAPGPTGRLDYAFDCRSWDTGCGDDDWMKQAPYPSAALAQALPFLPYPPLEGGEAPEDLTLRDWYERTTPEMWLDASFGWFGMGERDLGEVFATVPLPWDPDGRFAGTHPVDPTEWNGFYRNMAFREMAWPRGNDSAGARIDAVAVFQDQMALHAPLIRGWLAGDAQMMQDWLDRHDPDRGLPDWLRDADGNPFWDDVGREKVPFWELARPRLTTDGQLCHGIHMLGMCMEHDVHFGVGSKHIHERKLGIPESAPNPVNANIPQGSAYARWNREHLVPIPYNVEGNLRDQTHGFNYDPNQVRAIHDPSRTHEDCTSPGVWQWSIDTNLNLTPDGFERTGPASPGWTWQRETGPCHTTPWEFWAEHAPYHAPDGSATQRAADILENYYRGAFLHCDTGRWMAASPNDQRFGTVYGDYGGSDVRCVATGADRLPGDNVDNTTAAVYSTYRTGGVTFDGNTFHPECWGAPRVPYGTYAFIGGPPPFPTLFYDQSTRFGTYNHGATDRFGQGEPVPGKPVGYACLQEDGSLVPAINEREYIPQRLHYWMQGGYRHDGRILAPPSPTFQSEPGAAGDFVVAEVGLGVLPPLVEALLRDALGIADGLLLGGIGPAQLPALGTQDAGVDLPGLAQQIDDGLLPFIVKEVLDGINPGLLDDVQKLLPDVSTASPIVPLAVVQVDPDVAFVDIVVHHSHELPRGVQGVFVVSDDDGETWTLLPGRGTPGVVGSSSGSKISLVEGTYLRGKEVVLGVQLLGADWADSLWSLDRLVVLPSGAPGAKLPAAVAGWTGSTAPAPADLMDQSAWNGLAGQAVVLDRPLHVPAGTELALSGVTLLPARGAQCGGHACPIVVEGHLSMDGGGIQPLDGVADDVKAAGQGAIVVVTGVLDAVDVTLRGLVGGIPVPGGELHLKDCWIRDSLFGPHVVLGNLSMSGCVVDGPVLGVYALGSQVRIQDNLFHRPARTAGLFDESWGVVRDNVMLHSKQSGFMVRSPLGNANLAMTNNVVQETGIGVAFHLALEDRLLPLDPLGLVDGLLDLGLDVPLPIGTEVPLEARSRVQGNAFTFNTLEAVGAGALTAPAVFGNNATHNNIGTLVHLLSNATVHHNTLYNDLYRWRDPAALRFDEEHGLLSEALPPLQRRPVADDGNLWAGYWLGLGGLAPILQTLRLGDLGVPLDLPYTSPKDARFNYWGPGDVRFGGRLPTDVMAAPGTVDVSGAKAGYDERPPLAMLTAPGYGGGLLFDLVHVAPDMPDVGRPVDLAEEVVGTLSLSRLMGILDDPAGLAGTLPLPLDELFISAIHDRGVAVALDLPPGDVQAVEVEGTFYATGLPDLDTLVTGTPHGLPMREVIEELAPLLPALPEIPTPSPRDPVQKTLQVNGDPTAWIQFTFNDILEAYADWKVLRIQPTPDAVERYSGQAWFDDAFEGGWLEADGVWNKDVRVHNSVVWPLITDLFMLSHSLVHGALNETLDAVTKVTQAIPLLPDPDTIDAMDLSIVPLPDGVLPFDGGLSLLGAARDQDPIAYFEARVVLEADAELLEELDLDAVLALGSGFSLDRVLGVLPARLPEGIDVRLEMRAMDASGLVSPWTGVRLLPDHRPPVPSVDVECVSLMQRDVPYSAVEPGFDDNRRASGLQQVALRAESLNFLDPKVFDIRENITSEDERLHVVRTWTIPDGGLGNAAIYAVRAGATDRAGHAASTGGTLILDGLAPLINVTGALVELKTLAESPDPFVGLERAVHLLGAVLEGVEDGLDSPIETILGTGQLLMSIVVDVTDVPDPDEVDAWLEEPFGFCGLQYVRVEKQLEQDGEWRTVVELDLDGNASVMEILEIDLLEYDGKWLNIRVQAEDRAGNQAEYETGNVLIDVVPPLPLPPVLECIPLPGLLKWGATDLVESLLQGNVSGLEQVRLLSRLASSAWVGVGDGGTTVRSPDGYTWTVTNAPGLPDLRAVTHDGNHYTAVGTQGRVLVSTDGIAWTQQSTPGTAHLFGVAENGNSDRVAVGGGGTVLHSSGAGGWEARESGTTSTLRSVAHGEGLWVAVGHSGTVVTSSDAVAWTPAEEVPATGAVLRSVAHGGNEWIAVGDSGTVLTSTDGQSWKTLPDGTQGPDGSHLYGVAHDGQGAWVAVGSGGTVYRSLDARDWEPASAGTSNRLEGIRFGGEGLWIAVGDWGTVRVSPDGLDWGSALSGTTRTLYDVVQAQWTTLVDVPVPRDDDQEWLEELPTEGLFLPGGSYFLEVAARDRAGNLASVVTDQPLPVDTLAPDIVPDGTLKDLEQALHIGLGDLVEDDLLGLVLELVATVDETVQEACELLMAVLTMVVDGVEEILDQATNVTSAALIATVNPVLQGLDGRSVQFEVFAEDHAGHASTWSTPELLVDLLPPLPIFTVADPIPECIAVGALPEIEWGARDPAAPESRPQSGLDRVRLQMREATGTWQNIGDSGPLGGTVEWTDTLRIEDLEAGAYELRIVARDLAGNDVHEPLDSFIVDPLGPVIRLLDDLKDLEGLRFISRGLVDVGGTVDLAAEVLKDFDTCGLLDAVLELSLDGGDWITVAQWDPAEGLPASFEYSFDPTGHAVGDGLTIQEGSTVRIQVTATDWAGRTAQDGMEEHALIDLSLPVPEILNLEELLECVTGDVQVQWGATDPVPGSGDPSGLAQVVLRHGSGGNGLVPLADSGALPEGTAQWSDETGFPSPGEGTHEVQVSAWDHAGHEGVPASYAFTVDLRTPEIDPGIDGILEELGLSEYLNLALFRSTDPDGLLHARVTDPGVSCGLAEVLLKVEVSVDGVEWEEVQEPLEAWTRPDGTKQTTRDVAHALDGQSFQGKHVRFRVVVTDVAGHGDDWTSGSAYVDLVPPLIDLPDLPDWIGLAGLVLDWTANDDHSGLAQDGTWMELLRQDGAVAATATPGDTLTVDAAMDGRTLDAFFYAVDNAGNEAEAPGGSVAVDTSPPLGRLTPLECVGVSALAEYGATDPLPSGGGSPSGLHQVFLDHRHPGSSQWEQVADSGALDGIQDWGGSHGLAGLSEGIHELRVRTVDRAGNEQENPAHDTFTVDFTPPDIQEPTGLLAVLADADHLGRLLDPYGGILEATVEDADDAACGLARAAIQIAVGKGPWVDLASWEYTNTARTTVDLSGTLDLDGLEGKRIGIQIVAEDRAGNEAIEPVAAPESVLVDRTRPVGTLVPGSLALDTDTATVVFEWTGEDPAPPEGGEASGLAYLEVTRLVRIPGETTWTADHTWTEDGPAGTVTLGDGTAPTGHFVRYTVNAVDEAGNTQETPAVTEEEIYVHFEAPTVAFLLDAVAGQGRGLFDVRDIGIRYADAGLRLDLGDGHGGATVRSPAAQGDLAFEVDLSHPDGAMEYTARAYLDGVLHAGPATFSGSTQWNIPVTRNDLIGTGDPPRVDQVVRLTIEVEGDNGLEGQTDHAIYYIDEQEILPAQWHGGWTLADGASLGSGRLELPGGATASWAKEVPSPRLILGTQVTLEERTGDGRFDLLTLQESTNGAGERWHTRASLHLDGTGTGLHLEYFADGGSSTVDLGRAITEGETHTLHMVLGPGSVSVFVDRVYVGEHALAASEGLGMERISFGGDDAAALVEGTTVRTLEYGFQSLLGSEVFVDDDAEDRWVPSGPGTRQVLRIDDGDDTEAVQIMRMSPTGSGFRVDSAQPFNTIHGSHVSLHFELQGMSGSTVIMALETPDGDRVMYAYALGSSLYISDGYQEDGVTPRPAKQFALINAWWHRIDVFLHGETYVAVLDQKTTMVARTFTDTDEALLRFHNGGILSGTGNPFNVDRIRFDVGNSAQDLAFTQPLSLFDWTSQGSGVSIETGEPGHLGIGRMHVQRSGSGVGYIHTPLDTFEGRYSAEVAFRPWRVSALQPDGVPDHQAVLAGTSGTLGAPTIDWALVMAPTGVQNHLWALHFVNKDGVKTQVSPTWGEGSPTWHSVRVHVDEKQGTISVSVDDGVQDSQFQGVSTSSQRLAIGDIWSNHPSWNGNGRGYYDDVAVYGFAGP